MKFGSFAVFGVVAALTLVSCAGSPFATPTSTPKPFADVAFGACAYLDENGNGQIDPDDPGIEGLAFVVLGWGDYTSKDGCAFVLIPGGVPDHLWPIVVEMRLPEDAPYEPVGPTQITVTKESHQGHFDFLFRPAQSQP